MMKLFDRDMDYSMVYAVVFLMTVGVLMIHSTTSGEFSEYSSFWVKQLLWGIISLAAMLTIVLVPYKFFYAFAYVFYGLGLVLLLVTDLIGTMGGGSERWIKLGPATIQPSEFMKIATILVLARYLSFKNNRPDNFMKCVVPFLIVLVPTALVLQQPDLGTALVYCAIVLPMLFWSGLDPLQLFFILSPGFSALFSAPFIPYFTWVTWVVFMFALVAAVFWSRYHFIVMSFIVFVNILAGIAIPVVYGHLKPYQQNRITTMLNPEADPRGAGWQVINSKIAIGSGGFFGKGLGDGRYTELGFLPRSYTDFVFSVVGEELGFVGALFVIGVISYLIYRAIKIAADIKNPFLSLASIGIGTVFAFHMFVNIGMVLGIMPVTGIPLPFLSYGGSACLSNAIMVGLLLNFNLNRHEY